MKKSTCTCPIYLKQDICKHIISICIALKKVGNQLPPAAKNVPVGDTRKPGRPRLAVLALLEQPQFRSLTDYNDISDLDDDDDDVIQPPSNNTASILTNSHSNLIVNHHFEPNEYLDIPTTSISNQNIDSDYMTDSHSINTYNYDHSSSSTNFYSTLNALQSNQNTITTLWNRFLLI